MSVTNINCIITTSRTIIVTKVVTKDSIFNTVNNFYRHIMGKLFTIEF